MQPTLVGLVTILIGGYLLVAGSIEAMLVLLMASMLMSGSAAIVLTALGSSSIPPVSVVSGFLLIRLLLANSARKSWAPACRHNAWYIIYATYGILSAAIMPRIFAGAMDVVPLRPISIKGLFDVVPLTFTSQNITSPFYITGSLVTAICAFVVMRGAAGAITFVRTAVVVCWTHVLLGLAGVLLPASVWGVFSALFRNGSYAITSQSIAGYSRITGIMPEPSTYAGFGFAWMVFLTECWLRDILPRRTGPAAGAMALILIFSTSSTAYLAIAGYVTLMVLRMMFFPTFFQQRKILILAASATVSITLCMALLVIKPSLVDYLLKIFLAMTVEKADSDSAIQRTFWAKQGITAFQVSHGLGIGAGSFRSSNIVTAILGSMGVIGIISYLSYVFTIFRPFRNSTYSKFRDPLDGVGVACAWTAVSYIIPALAGAASPDPGALFSLFAGAALGLRSLPLLAHRSPLPAPILGPVQLRVSGTGARPRLRGRNH